MAVHLMPLKSLCQRFLLCLSEPVCTITNLWMHRLFTLNAPITISYPHLKNSTMVLSYQSILSTPLWRFQTKVNTTKELKTKITSNRQQSCFEINSNHTKRCSHYYNKRLKSITRSNRILLSGLPTFSKRKILLRARKIWLRPLI